MLKEMNMKNRIFVTVFIIACLFYNIGCSRPVATVNGKKIDRATFDLHLKEKIEGHKEQNVTPDMKKLKDAVVQELIAERLIIEEAEAKGIKVSDDELNREIDAIKKNMGEDAFNKTLKERGLSPERFRSRTREKMIMQRFVGGLATDDSISEETLREYYKNSPTPFIKQAKVLMKMIEISSEESARAIINEMKTKKTDFDEMAKRLADEKKAIVSEYGWVTPSFFSPAISQAVKNLSVGQYGGPYKGLKNYFLIKIKDREKEGIAKFDEVKDNIKSTLLEQKRQAAISHLLAEKRKTAKIEIKTN